MALVAAERAANTVLHALWDWTLPVDVRALLEKAERIRLEEAPLDNLSGEVERTDDGNYIIRINAGDGEQRKRFTMAHEFGHVALGHLERNGNKFLRDPAERGTPFDYKPEERDANLFAAELLMPSQVVRDAIHNGHKDIVDLAELFHVSRQAMRVRLVRLGILPEWMLNVV